MTQPALVLEFVTCEICGEEFHQNPAAVDLTGYRRGWQYGADFLGDLRSHYNWRQRPGKGCLWKKTFGATT